MTDFYILVCKPPTQFRFNKRSNIFNLIWKDKSRRNIGVDEFQLTSRKFIIYPEYGVFEGVQTHDICLIQTPENEFGIFEDLSPKFDSIPCLPESFDSEKVQLHFKISLINAFTIVTWKILLGRRLGSISIKWRFLRFIEINRCQPFWSSILPKS